MNHNSMPQFNKTQKQIERISSRLIDRADSRLDEEMADGRVGWDTGSGTLSKGPFGHAEVFTRPRSFMTPGSPEGHDIVLNTPDGKSAVMSTDSMHASLYEGMEVTQRTITDKTKRQLAAAALNKIRIAINDEDTRQEAVRQAGDDALFGEFYH